MLILLVTLIMMNYKQFKSNMLTGLRHRYYIMQGLAVNIRFKLNGLVLNVLFVVDGTVLRRAYGYIDS